METVLVSVIAAVVYSLAIYMKKKVRAEDKDSFDIAKFITTAIWGAIIGLVMVYSGIPVNEQTIEAQFVVYAGLIAITEEKINKLVKYIAKLIR